MSKYKTKYKQEFIILDKRYNAVGRHIKKLVDGVSVTPLIIEGPAGVGKTTMVRKFLEEYGHTRYELVAGKLTPMALYMWIHKMKNNGAILILDDTDSTLENTDALNILKAATDTSKRHVSWITARPIAGLPLQFETEGSIIILSNSTFSNSTRSKKKDHLDAIMSRSLHQTISDDNDEHKFIQLCYTIFTHGMLGNHTTDEIDVMLEYIESRIGDFKKFDLRTAQKLSEIYVQEPDTWRDTADVML